MSISEEIEALRRLCIYDRCPKCNLPVRLCCCSGFGMIDPPPIRNEPIWTAHDNTAGWFKNEFYWRLGV